MRQQVLKLAWKVCVVANAGAEMGSIVAGTNTRTDTVATAGVEVCTIVDRILSVCVVVSGFLVLANVQLGIVGMAMETPE